MRIVFIGVVTSGWFSLKTLLEKKANIVGIFTADNQKMAEYSGMHPSYFGNFDELAKKYAVPLYKIDTVQSPIDLDMLRALEPDLIYCIGWPQLIRKDLLKFPKYGCLGIHPTLLPERRGGAPLNWGIIDGLQKSGVTLFYFNEGVDSGDILAQKSFEITLDDNCQTVLEKVNRISAELVSNTYPLLEKGKAIRTPQDNSKATYTRRRRLEQGVIDWRMTSLSIHNWVRGLSLPFPGAFTYWQRKKVIVWEAELLIGYRAKVSAQPGEFLESMPEKGIVIATGDNGILVKTVEIEGRKVRGDVFIKDFTVNPGSIMGEPK
jgi:methionyl-tRNA formyltransferase